MSSLAFGILMYAVMLPVLLVMAALLANETRQKKNLILGVTLPYTAPSDPEVAALCARFRRQLWIGAAALALLGVPSLFVPWFSVQFTVLMVWMVVVILAPNILYARTHQRLKALKRARGWYRPRESSATVVDITSAAQPRRALSAWGFLPPLLLSLVPVALALTVCAGEQGMETWLAVGLSFAGTTALSWVLYPLIFRARTDVAGEDSAVNIALTNVRRAAWGRAWMYIAWSTALCGLAAFLFRSSGAGQLAVILVYTFVLLGLCVRTELGVRREQERLTAAPETYVDEDEQWLWGLFYCNPNDRHLTVNARVGMNMTVNLARPGGKLLMGFCVLSIAAMPLLGVWLMAVEFSPRRVTADGAYVEVVHLTKQFGVTLSESDSAALLETLPRAWRTNGTGMDTLLEGHFTVDGYGACRLCLNPRAAPFIVLVTEDGTYLFNAETPEETRNVFNTIRREIHAEN